MADKVVVKSKRKFCKVFAINQWVLRRLLLPGVSWGSRRGRWDPSQAHPPLPILGPRWPGPSCTPTLASSSTAHPGRGRGGEGMWALTWAGPGSAVWLGQATAKVPSAALGSLEGRLPAGLSVG